MKLAPIDALAEALQHDPTAAGYRLTCTHSPSIPPRCCWCGADITTGATT